MCLGECGGHRAFPFEGGGQFHRPFAATSQKPSRPFCRDFDAVFLRWAGIWPTTFSKWKQCYGKEFEHNGWIPRDHWFEPWERDAIISFYHANPLNGYRRLTYMMLDANVVAVSAGTVYNVLSKAGLLKRCNQKSSKGTGFVQPDAAHRHWHTDIAYLNIAGTFYFIASVLDGYSRSVIHWEIREKMEESDIEIILQAAKEKFPDARPRIITDNGPQFIAKDFKEFIRISGMTHVKTSPVRLHSALGYITPQDKLEGREQQIFAERDRKLMEARLKRAVARLHSRKKIAAEKTTKLESLSYSTDVNAEDRALLGSNLSAGLMLNVSTAVGPAPAAPAAYV